MNPRHCLLLLVLSVASLSYAADFPDASAELRSKAEAGDANAQYAIGDLYYFGQGIPQDSKQARKWFRLAAAQGHAEAQLSLAVVNGQQGGSAGYAEPLAAVRRAADGGDATAQWKLGMAYVTGLGVRPDAAEGLKWFHLAADQHLAEAQYALGYGYYLGQGVRQNYPEALKWYRLAADQGAAFPQFYIGLMYEVGRGVPQDYAEAAKWYRLAAERGKSTAQFNLGVFYYNGRGVERDYAEAFRLYRLSAEQGYDRALLNVGLSYLEGEGVPQDYVAALKYLSVSSAVASDREVQSRSKSGIKVTKRQLDRTQIADAERQAQEWIEAFKKRQQE